MRWSRLLAGADTTARMGLPAHELLAPLPLFALGVLALNDWVLKGSSAPEWLTGKLSDFAGLFAFPLIVTAVIDLAGFALARAGLLWDYTLRRYKLAASIGTIAVVFAAMKLSPVVGSWVERVWSGLVPGDSAIYPDRTDVIALVALVGTWLYGRRAIARGAYGRLAFARRRYAAKRPLPSPFGDATRCGADPAVVRTLDAAVAAWLGGGPAEPVDAALAQLRAR